MTGIIVPYFAIEPECSGGADVLLSYLLGLYGNCDSFHELYGASRGCDIALRAFIALRAIMPSAQVGPGLEHPAGTPHSRAVTEASILDQLEIKLVHITA